MSSILKVFLGFVLLVLLSTSVSAVSCNFDAVINSAQVRSDSDLVWSSSVDAEFDDFIDIQTNVRLNKISGGSECNGEFVEAKADIFGYRNGNWQFIQSTQTFTEFVFFPGNETLPIWFNVFRVDDIYDKYRVDVFVKEMGSSGWDDSQSAFVFVDEASVGVCSDIKFIPRTITIDEDDIVTEFFSIENNSNKRFNVSELDAFDNSSIVNVQEINFDSSIPANSTGDAEIEIESFNVSYDRTVSGFVKIRGNFSGGRSCSFSDIGTEDFSIRVLETNGGSSTCSSIDLRLEDVIVDEDSFDTFDFTIKNNSSKTFIVDDIDLRESSPYFNVEDVFFDSFISSFSSGDLRVRVNTFPVSGDRTGIVDVRVTGRFSGGNSCSPTQIGVESFRVTVDESFSSEACNDIRINTRNVSIPENSTEFETFSITNRSNRDFVLTDVKAVSNNTSIADVEVEDFDRFIDSDDSASVDLRFDSESVSSNRSTNAYLQAEGRFVNGRTCNFSSIPRSNFSISVRNDGSSSSTCSQIDVISRTIRISEGETEFESFNVRNRSNRNFIIDNVTVSDSDSAFTSSAYQWDDRINANGSGTITARIKANNVSRDETGTARVSVRGHFSDGRTCSSSQVGVTNITVIVENFGGTSSACNDFKLSVPNFKRINERDFFTISIDNPLNRSGTINLSGSNLSISPRTISIPRNSFFNEEIEVELLSGTRSFLVYDVDLSNCNILSKTTEIIGSSLSDDVRIVSFPSVSTIKKSGIIPVTIRNNSGFLQQVEVFLEALPSSISSSKETLNISSGSSKTAQINVSGDIDGDYSAKLVVRVDNARQEKDLTIRFSDSDVSTDLDVKLSASQNAFSNAFNVLITLTNNSFEKLDGRLEFNIPNNWVVEGNKSFVLGSREKKTFSFSVNPNASLSETELIGVDVFYDGKQVSEFVELIPSINPFSTGFASLGGSFVNIILIIIIIILVYALWRRGK